MSGLSDIDLPDGFIRDIIALAFTGTIVHQVFVGALDVATFIGIAGPFLGFYVAEKANQSKQAAIQAANEPDVVILGAPSIPDGVDSD